ncbi:MAG TPA: methyltransferase domain-containing protein [Candidatus Nitrosotalea sp.]|nr:methyltransferase domain-containing protein [Candidatus Nitrosotalea sp.]
MKIPFVDFYKSRGIIPTRQDISNLDRHIERRLSLYRHLGLPPGAFRNVAVAEFGPGSGHNAVVTGLLGPRRYLLVDGNPPSLKSTKSLLKRYCPKLRFELRQSSILQFRSEEKFDVVLCEAVIPTQKNPPAFLRHVARFVRPGGVLVITCMDSISLLPEMLRRWLAWDLVRDIRAFEDKVTALAKFFRPDLDTLPGMSRPAEDWVIDQILHPWAGPLFSIPQAVSALSNRAMVLGCSPRFLLDWRWYKNIHGDDCADNSFAVKSYYRLGLNLLDYRVNLNGVDESAVRHVELVSQTIYDRIFARERGKGNLSGREINSLLKPLIRILRAPSPITTRSVESFAAFVRSGMKNVRALRAFRGWWGRGQQYLSFVKR